MSEMLEFMFKLDVAMNNGFSQPAKAMSNEMQKLVQAGQRMQAQMGKTQELDALRQKVQASESGLSYLRAERQRNAESLDASRKRTATLGSEYEHAKKRVDEWSKTLPKNSAQLMLAKKRADELRVAYQSSVKDVSRLEREQETLYKKAGIAEQSLDREREKLSQLESELQKTGLNTQKLSSEQEKLSRAMERVSRAESKMSKIRETLSWGNLKSTFMKGLSVYAPVKPLVKISGDFEEAMQKVKAVGFSSEGADLTKFSEMKAQSLRLGAETSFTAIQAANAQENLIRAGFTPDETMSAMPGLLNMAAAEGLDLAQAAGIVAGSIRSIGLEARDAAKIADMFAFASANSATNIANIGEAFAGTAGTARGLKVEAEQLTAMLMSLANQQVEASQAGTAMSSTFMRLAKEPKATAEALAKYHVAIMTRAGDMRELPDILAELYKNTEKYGSKNQIQAFANVFGVSFGDAMFKLAQASLPGKDGGLSEYEQNLKAIREKAPGQAQRMTDINLDSLNGQLTILGSAIDGVKIALGDMFNPIVRQGVELLTTALSKLNGILLEFPNASKGVVLTLSAFAGMKVASGVLNIGKAILSLPGAWLEYMNATRTAAALTGTQVSSMGGMLSVLMHPVAALKTAFTSLWGVVAAHPFVAVTAAIGAIYYYWDDIKEAGVRAWTQIKEAGERLAVWWNGIDFSEKWNMIRELGTRAWTQIRNACESFAVWWNGIDFSEKWNMIRELGVRAWEQIRIAGESFVTWWNSIELSDVWQSVIEGFNAMINYFTEKWQSFKEFFSSLNPFAGIPASAQAQQVKNAEAALGGYMPPSIKPHAYGGIMTSPHIGLVAEAGPEAIIPLRDKSRGQEVLRQAANILGMDTGESIAGLTGVSANEHGRRYVSVNSDGNLNGVSDRASNVINIQVDGRNTDDNNLAERIASAVRNVLREISSEQVRLNYA